MKSGNYSKSLPTNKNVEKNAEILVAILSRTRLALHSLALCMRHKLSITQEYKINLHA